MSRSPKAEKARQALDEYIASWRAITRLLREGLSWSGYERNCAYLNCGDGRFADVSAATGLDFDDDGRALAVVDWDHDGDLDLWLYNRTGPRLRLMLNQSPADGDRSVAFRLRGTHANRDGVGARVEVELEGDRRRLVETLYAGDAYLSQSSKWVHFGLGESPEIRRVTVAWPGGDREAFAGVVPGGRYLLVEGSGRAEETPRRAAVTLAPSPPSGSVPGGGVKESAETRLFLPSRVPLPSLSYETGGDTPGVSAPVHPGPGPDTPALLLNLWASWCGPCVTELKGLTERRDEVRAAGLDVIALTVEEVDGDEATGAADAARLLDRIDFPFRSGVATTELLEKIELVEAVLYDRKWPLGVPVSFLLDRQGRLAATYRGPVDLDALLEDVAALDGSSAELHSRSAPIPGRWHARTADVDLLWLGSQFRDLYPREMEHYYELELERQTRLATRSGAPTEHQQRRRGVMYLDLAQAAFENGRIEDSMTQLRKAIEVDPGSTVARLNLAQLLRSAGRTPEAVDQYRGALKVNPADAEAHYGLGTTLLAAGEVGVAFDHLREAARLSPESPAPLHAMIWVLLNYSNPDDRRQLGEALELAERGVEMTDRQDARMLDALAAAQAAMGEYDLAVETAEQAGTLARAAGEAALLSQIELRLRFFRRGLPFREGATPPA